VKKLFYVTVVFLLTISSSDPGWSSEIERREQGNLVIEEIPEIPQQIIDRMLQYQNVRSAYIEDWDFSGEGMLISTRFGETYQIHYLEKPGGARKQITFFAEPVNDAAMCPDPSKPGFLFMKDVGGSEFYQVFYFDLKSGKHKMLTDGSSRNGDILWANKGNRFVYYSTKRNGRDWDLHLAYLENPDEAKPILEEGGTWSPVDWSPDDKHLLVAKYISINETYPHILDIESGKLTQINPSDEKIAYGAGVWAGNGKGIFITSDEDSEFKRLKYYDIEKKKFIDLTADIPWDVEALDISPKGDRLAFTANEGGVYKLYLLDTATHKYIQVPGIPLGLVYGLRFHPDGSKLALIINSPQTPSDIYTLQLGDNSLTRWTYSEVGGLNTDSFAVPELIQYETFDKVDGKPRMIPAFYYKPREAKKPFPVIIYAHGGPEGQYQPYFSSTLQYWLNELGVALLAPNVRGSDGYGKSYLKLDNGFKREDTVKDIGKLLDWVDEQPELDASRIAIFGGSYGGYMVLASMIHYNDRFKCGVDVVGISNFVTFLENTKDYRRDLRRVEYGDERDPKMREFLNRISPTTNANRISSPMLIVQGLNDPRVPVGESEQIVEAIRNNGGIAWYLLAKDEGHGFRKKPNRDYYTHATVLFLEKHLLQ
jgi:dipeptidyl aminopeptidase/acylaminoacyl peptidase